MVSHCSSAITAAMRAASLRRSVPTQLWTLYDAIRRHAGLRCSESAFQLARLSAGFAMETPTHAREPALHRPDASAEEPDRAGHQPPVHLAGAGERGLDRISEDRGGERARNQPDRRAEHYVAQPHVDGAGDDALDREG